MKKRQFLEALAGIVGGEHLVTDAAQMAPALVDWRGRYTGRALALARPGCTAEVVAIVRLCLAYAVPMVPQGGNTGLCGGATPDDSGDALVIQLCRMRRIRAIDPANNTLVAEAGATLAEVRAAAQEAGRLFPLWLASGGSAQIGGNLSTNAGGVHVLRYGTMRDLTLGVEAVLPNGECLPAPNLLRKNNTGYDLKHLLVGAEGTLGIITAAALKLFAPPQSETLGWLGLASPAAAVALLERTRGRFAAGLTAFELISPRALQLVYQHVPDMPRVFDAPWHVLVELGTWTEDEEGAALREAAERFWATEMESGRILDAILARTPAQARKLWALREHISEAQRREGVSVKHDIALPISRIPEFLEQVEPLLARAFPGIRHVTFGHLGDGNLHFNLSHADPAANTRLLAHAEEINRIVYDLVHHLSGSISAEHGLGQLKRETIRRYKSPPELAAMQSIKTALDPKGLMNPGKLLP
ncbi:MAG: FAD-binding oxidoreductase [Zoogloeaceae bacterium]|jgi:FAD/FMN-containing dehydrogenase|nr:FAD-binding oxidoreductase [Zoogloeaceae bacterium]